jgi:hypothetical protein
VGVDMALDEIVAGAALHRLARDGFITRRTENEDQGIGSRPEHLIESLETLAVGQRKVKQQHLDTAPAQSFKRIREPRHPFDAKRAFARTGKRLLDQFGVSAIVLDEEHTGGAARGGARRAA